MVLVEGQTEEAFLKEVMAPYLYTFNLIVTPTIINTRIVKDGPNFKGGAVYFDKAKRDLFRLLSDKSIYVTTFFDYYRLGKDFPKLTEANQGNRTVYQRIEILENAFNLAIDNSRFKGYIQPHEFEALLFASFEGFKANFSDELLFLEKIESIIQEYPNPEEINDQPQTAPSKRMLNIKQNYDKVFHGNMIALDNGIEVILDKCLHFESWVNWMKTLVNTPTTT